LGVCHGGPELMPEMAHTSENHCQVELIRRRDD
jgi:hypothetical protein